MEKDLDEPKFLHGIETSPFWHQFSDMFFVKGAKKDGALSFEEKHLGGADFRHLLHREKCPRIAKLLESCGVGAQTYRVVDIDTTTDGLTEWLEYRGLLNAGEPNDSSQLLGEALAVRRYVDVQPKESGGERMMASMSAPGGLTQDERHTFAWVDEVQKVCNAIESRDGFHCDQALVLATIYRESRGTQGEEGPIAGADRQRALGLMQVMPVALEEFNKYHPDFPVTLDDLTNDEDQVAGEKQLYVGTWLMFARCLPSVRDHAKWLAGIKRPNGDVIDEEAGVAIASYAYGLNRVEAKLNSSPETSYARFLEELDKHGSKKMLFIIENGLSLVKRFRAILQEATSEAMGESGDPIPSSDSWSGRFILPIGVPSGHFRSPYVDAQGVHHGGHSGLDGSTMPGCPIFCPTDGVVRMSGRYNGIGFSILVEHPSGHCSVFGHLADFTLNKGDTVKAGQCVGHVGKTGNTDVNHLHYEVLKPGVKGFPASALFKLRSDPVAFLENLRVKFIGEEKGESWWRVNSNHPWGG